MISSDLWYSSDATSNVQQFTSAYPGIFRGMAEIDHLGHTILEGAIDTYRGLPWETTLGLALLRRAVTQFGGIRYLCEHSSIQPATLVARAHFETLLATRYLLYGSKRHISGLTPSTSRGRERRARYYRTEELRREIYRRQAALDGRFGGRKLDAATRAGVTAEIAEGIAFLKKHFSAQQRAFGSFLCFPDPQKPNKRLQHYDKLAWYSFGFKREKRGKVTNIRSLAVAFGWLRDYELLYEAFSGFAHVRGLHHDVQVEPGGIAVRVPHAPDDFNTVVYFGIQRQLFMLNCLARAYHPASRPLVQIVDLQVRNALDVLQSSLPLGIT